MELPPTEPLTTLGPHDADSDYDADDDEDEDEVSHLCVAARGAWGA